MRWPAAFVGRLAITIAVLAALSGPGAATLYGFDGQAFKPKRFRYTSPDGHAFVIGVNGLETVTDLNGNVLTLTPSGITHSAGRGAGLVREADELLLGR